MEIRVGTDNKGNPIILSEEAWEEHCAIFGRTGSGKSFLTELICMQLIDQGEGFTLIDPDNDTAESLRNRIVEGWDDL